MEEALPAGMFERGWGGSQGLICDLGLTGRLLYTHLTGMYRVAYMHWKLTLSPPKFNPVSATFDAFLDLDCGCDALRSCFSIPAFRFVQLTRGLECRRGAEEGLQSSILNA